MPFKVTCPVEERIPLLRDYDTGAFTVSDLDRRCGSAGRRFVFGSGAARVARSASSSSAATR